jgi:P-type conjugative transfer protein TrbJ
MKTRITKFAAVSILAAATLGGHVQAQGITGIPTGDFGNYVQNTIAAQEGIKQTMQQVEEYKTQLQQYFLQIKNATAPAAYVWDQATRTMDQLRDAMYTLEYYRRQLGDINFYLRQFNDTSDYRQSPCFKKGGCTAEDMAQLRGRQDVQSTSQKKANEALLRTVDAQQQAMQADAKRLEQLQQNAQGAQGQMEAIGAANMLASQQSNQLLQMRSLMAAQNAALVTRMQAQADREAREDAASEAARSGTYTRSAPREW